MKKKIKITISIDRNLYSEVDEITTNKSRLIELLLVEYFKKLGKDTSNIYL
jgi:hypothetical protein